MVDRLDGDGSVDGAREALGEAADLGGELGRVEDLELEADRGDTYARPPSQFAPVCSRQACPSMASSVPVAAGLVIDRNWS
jgi:hypothetical protein